MVAPGRYVPGVDSRSDVDTRAARRVGFGLAEDLAGHRCRVAAAEQEVAHHVHERAALRPREVAVRPHPGGVPEREQDRGDRVGRRRCLGPQHPVLPEPLHLDLVVEDEKVIKAVPQIGFVHRGLEKLVETRDYNQFIFVAERICGICAFGHSMGYAETVESLMGVEIPPRAQYLRTIWHELSRVHSHILWLGLAADAFGF